jgi:hypothetical protein
MSAQNSKLSIALPAFLTILLLIPIFWHQHIAAGDLPSHTYNAWLAQLIHKQQAPGLYTVAQFHNVLFDLLLLYSAKILGLAAAEKFSVALCVLIFFWGTFAFAAAASRRLPWTLTPLIAMFSYGYVFYLGFMNFYLSIGLAALALSILWPGTRRGFFLSLLIAPFILFAHPIGFLFYVGGAVYRLLWRQLRPAVRLILPAAIAILAFVIRLYFLHHPQFEPDWEPTSIFLRNGFDQLNLFGPRFATLSYVTLAFCLLCSILDFALHAKSLRVLCAPASAPSAFTLLRKYLRLRSPIPELYVAAFISTALLPQDFKPSPDAGWVGVIVTRLTIITAIFAVAWLATMRPKLWHLAGLTIAAAVFFAFTWQETRTLNRLEDNADRIISNLPYGTRVLASVFADPDNRTMYIHSVERACISRCFVYSNYEPSTREFRIRVLPGSPIVTASPDDSEDMQFGIYEVQTDDLPLKQIYQCDPSNLTALCIRDLSAGEQNNRTGYRPPN